jgi:hypothetical protein
MFDANAFLTKEFGGAHNVLALFTRYGLDPPHVTAIEKWFQRGSVPGSWLACLVSLLELDRGQPVSLARYTKFGA